MHYIFDVCAVKAKYYEGEKILLKLKVSTTFTASPV